MGSWKGMALGVAVAAAAWYGWRWYQRRQSREVHSSNPARTVLVGGKAVKAPVTDAAGEAKRRVSELESRIGDLQKRSK